MELKTQGLHHITAITSDASSAVKFYTRILGLRLVKKTVNFDDPSAYHLYFGDEKGSPGTILTFFDWGREIVYGQIGAGVTHHLAFTTQNGESLGDWKAWLKQNHVNALGPFDRGSFSSLYFQDPDGLILEIATMGNGSDYSDTSQPELNLQFSQGVASDKGRAEQVGEISIGMKLQGLHHATALTHGSSQSREFYAGILNMELVKDNKRGSSGTAQHIFGLEAGRPGSMISFVESPVAPRGTVGVGTVHHIAFGVEDESAQLKWRERLVARGVHRSLTLPAWLESRRRAIEASLKPISPVA